MTTQEILAEAEKLEAEARLGDAYAQLMEQTTVKTNGQFGHLHNPLQYAAHLNTAAAKRQKAAQLRASITAD
ncbi:MAG: hypothetical protein AB1765_12880 [Candidatus Hydrogenedentota bacterium]